MGRQTATRAIENAVRRCGFCRVAGVDEVGRGCLAGPVVAAAVILDPTRTIAGLRDSKLLSAAVRERLSDVIFKNAMGWALAAVGPAEVDRINVHQASFRAMRDAIGGLVPQPDFVLVDGFAIPDLSIPQRAVIGGDRRCSAIAAASIIAKVSRDRGMCELHARDPRYGFDRHKGYPTPQHRAALSAFGYSPAHRRSFRSSSV